MFSEALLDHFKYPRNAGELANATATIEMSNPVCGDVLRLAIRVENYVIQEARFLCRGCTTAIACGSVLTEHLIGKQIEALRVVSPAVIEAVLGELPSASAHAAQLAVDAAAQLYGRLPAKQ